MSNPYLIQGPAQISFSGGRSSAMMLCKIVEAHGGTLPPDLYVHFANTGKEREETLVFVDRVAKHLGINVRWVEFAPDAVKEKDRWQEVTFAIAARHGEPFDAMIKKRGYMPNPVARVCTIYLKLFPMAGLMRSYGVTDYATVAGIRFDEPWRVAKMRGRKDTEFVLPLADAKVTKADVATFWQAMPFDLTGVLDSNCDLCYLKGAKRLLGLIRQEPSRADWWIKAESGGSLFRNDRPNYAALKIIAMQPQLFDDLPAEDAMPCECTD